MRVRRLSVPVLAFAAGVALTPAVAMAATGLFTSSTTTPAVRALNTTGAGPAVQAEASGSGNKAAIYSRNTATGDGSNAFYSRSYVLTGEHYGIRGLDSSELGAGARGDSNARGGTGVLGVGAYGAGVVGAGAYGVVSDGELGAAAHLIGMDQNIAGDCTLTVAEGTATPCRFTAPFPAGITPRVVVTPTSNPGSPYWVSGVGVGGFSINTGQGVTADTTFSYVVVGTLPSDGSSPLNTIVKRAPTAQK